MQIHEIRVDHIGEDSRAAKLSREVQAELGEEVNLQTTDVYYIEGVDAAQADENLTAWDAGSVEAGPKQVIIDPKNLVFAGKTLGVR